MPDNNSRSALRIDNFERAIKHGIQDDSGLGLWWAYANLRVVGCFGPGIVYVQDMGAEDHDMGEGIVQDSNLVGGFGHSIARKPNQPWVFLSSSTPAVTPWSPAFRPL